MWGADHLHDLVGAILRLCTLFISLGTAARSDLFPSFRDEACPITLACFREGAVATFRSLHPCATFNHGTQHPPNPAQGLEHPTLVYHAGMHWLREEGFQGLRSLSVETGEQFVCPLCRQPVAFARKYNIC